jgi:hypothetical protein
LSPWLSAKSITVNASAWFPIDGDVNIMTESVELH